MCLARNRARLDAVTLTPRFMVDVTSLELSTELFGQRYELPFRIAPVGLSGLMWPGAELILAAAAARAGIPYCLSTLSTVEMEEIGELPGPRAWFQLYATKDADVAGDLVHRAAIRPSWLAQVLRGGRPKFRNVARYAPSGTPLESFVMEQFLLRPLS